MNLAAPISDEVFDDKYYNKIRGNSEEKEKERQDLLQVVQHYRRENPDLLKASLAKKWFVFFMI